MSKPRVTTEERCEHRELNWAPDGLDGMRKHCGLYLMKPECVSETYKWFKANGLPWGEEEQV